MLNGEKMKLRTMNTTSASLMRNLPRSSHSDCGFAGWAGAGESVAGSAGAGAVSSMAHDVRSGRDDVKRLLGGGGGGNGTLGRRTAPREGDEPCPHPTGPRSNRSPDRR